MSVIQNSKFIRALDSIPCFSLRYLCFRIQFPSYSMISSFMSLAFLSYTLYLITFIDNNSSNNALFLGDYTQIISSQSISCVPLFLPPVFSL